MATKVIASVKCDFCSEPNVTWDYPARTYEVKSVGPFESMKVNSVENWAACDICHGLIGRGDWHGLAKRSAERLLAATPMPLTLEAVTTGIAAMHQEFRANWLGPPVKVKADQK